MQYSTPQEEARKLISELRAVMAPNSKILSEIERNFTRLTTEIETLKYGADFGGANTDVWLGGELTAKEVALLKCLRGSGERGMQYYGILCAMYADRPENSWPGEKIIQVWVTKIRKKFYMAGYTNPVSTRWGAGLQYSEPVKSPDFAKTYPHKRAVSGETLTGPHRHKKAA